MIIATTYINMAFATETTDGYEFKYSVYNSVKSATALFLINFDTLQSAPCIVELRESGTYVITAGETVLYTNLENDNLLLDTDPDE